MSKAAGGSSQNAIPRVRPNFSVPRASFATIIVGPEKIPFTVHETLISHYSDFFRAALNGKFKESEEKRVTLNEEDPVVFEAFVYWIYNQQLPKDLRDQNGELIADRMDGSFIHVDFFVHLYIMSEKYSIKELYRPIIDALFSAVAGRKAITLPEKSTIHRAFDCLRPDSPMCRLLITIHYLWGSQYTFNDLGYYENVPFIQGVICYLMGTVDKKNIGACHFHDHSTLREKDACKNKGVWTDPRTS